MSAIEIFLVVAVLVIIVRNFRKDKSDGRDPLGGGGGTWHGDNPNIKNK